MHHSLKTKTRNNSIPREGESEVESGEKEKEESVYTNDNPANQPVNKKRPRKTRTKKRTKWNEQYQ